MIVQPFSYFQEIVGGAVGIQYVIRTNAYSGSVKLAVPGTNFGASTFGQSNYYSDISATVRGTGNNVNMVATGSLLYASSSIVNSGSYVFADDGYTTSIFTEDATDIGVASNTEFGFSNNSFVVEAWIALDERLYSPGAPFHKNILRDVGGGNNFSIDISFVSQNSTQYRMRTILNGTQHFTGNLTANLGTYYYYAWVRSGNNMYMYQNGTRLTPSPATNTATQGSIQTRILGGDMNVNDGAKGVVQDLMLTIGTDKGYRFPTIPSNNSIVSVAQTTGVVEDGLQIYLDAGNTTSYNGSGATWFDLSGNSNNGTLVNSPTFTSGTSGYFQLNGSNQYVRLPKGLNQSGNTFMIIAKSTPGSKAQRTMMTTLLTGTTTSSTPYRDLSWNTTTVDTYSYITSPGAVAIASSYNLNQWYSFTITEGNCSQNGFFDDTQTITNRTLDAGGSGENQEIVVGTGYWGYANMQVAAILVYNKKLTNAQILQNYNVFNARY